MKVVLFCGGLGTRIREYSEAIPKPMVPIGHQPILWHVMEYYSHFGHTDFILCLGYKAMVIKEFFLTNRRQSYIDCVISTDGSKIEPLGKIEKAWRVSLIDTGVWRTIGERLWAVRDFVKAEDIFLATYRDGLCDAGLGEMIDIFRRSGKLACFLAVRPPLTYHVVDMDNAGTVRGMKKWEQVDLRINGGFFLLRPRIFEYMREGEELVVEPFQRLADEGQLMAFKHDGFWRSMDTLRDRQSLEDMVEQGNMPWSLGDAGLITRNRI